MKDKMTIRVSEEFRQYIAVLVAEVVLEGKPFENQKKYLRLYCETEGVNAKELEQNLYDFFKLVKTKESFPSIADAVHASKIGNSCFLSNDFLNDILSPIDSAHQKESEQETLLTPQHPYMISRYGKLSATDFGEIGGNLEIPPTVEGITVTYIADKTFLRNKKINSVVIPNTVHRIGRRAFEGCHNMKVAVIPDSVTNIEDAAFSGCDNLLRVDLPASLSEIPGRLFFGCKKLTDIDIPPRTRYIGEESFQDCALKSIIIPETVSFVGEKAFYCCKELQRLVLPDKELRIHDFAFGSCISLRSVVLPKSVILSEYAFVGCKNLKDLYIGRRNFERIKKQFQTPHLFII